MEWYTVVGAMALGLAWSFVRDRIVHALERRGVPNASHGLFKLFVVVVCVAGAIPFALTEDWSDVAFLMALPTVIAFRAWLRHETRKRDRRDAR